MKESLVQLDQSNGTFTRNCSTLGLCTGNSLKNLLPSEIHVLTHCRFYLGIRLELYTTMRDALVAGLTHIKSKFQFLKRPTKSSVNMSTEWKSLLRKNVILIHTTLKPKKQE